MYVHARLILFSIFFFQAEDGIRDLVRSRGLGDVYKRQAGDRVPTGHGVDADDVHRTERLPRGARLLAVHDLSLIHI